jgi:hypothetical protein
MLEFMRVALFVCGGGGLGGLLYWTALYLSAASSTEDTSRIFPPTRAFCLAQVFTGMGGAWAVLLATIWGKRACLAPTLEEELELVAMSLVAGYAGNRLLPLVADQLTKQIVKDAERRVAKSAMQAKRSELTAEVFAYLDVRGSQSAHQTLAYEKKLKAELKKDGSNRKAAILLARLYAELQRSRDKAIQVLESFIKTKLANGGRPDSDVADAYWNICNYYEQEYQVGDKSDPSLRTRAIEAVARSIAIVPGYLKNLWEDDDFKELRESDEAKKKLPPYPG